MKNRIPERFTENLDFESSKIRARSEQFDSFTQGTHFADDVF